MIITRFAPSPTGDLHIGGARTALFNYLFAKHHQFHGQGGKFLLRIEDTDKKRSTDAAINTIIHGLNWLGINYDDELVRQSENEKRHQEIVQQLLEKNVAYQCFTAKEELDELRKKAQDKGEVFRFKSPWRDKINSQSSTIKPVIRIKSPVEGFSTIDDLVQGQVKIPNIEIDDFVIARSDGTPTYMLAVVVDDFDMKITHIIRGDDHLTNSFKQKIIYDALNWENPKFAHIPLIYGNDGAKMSKRHGATSVTDYQKMGYLPEAMRNYLLRLGWSHNDDEIISDEQAISWFNIENINKSPARFDFAKLDFINKYYLKKLTNTEIYNLIIDRINNCDFVKNRKSNVNNSEQNRINNAIEFIKEKAANLNEIADSCQIYLDNYQTEITQQNQEKVGQKKDLIAQILKILNDISDWQIDNIKQELENFCQQQSLKLKDFGPVVRILLTFSDKSSGGIFDVISLLGKDNVIARISKFSDY